MPHILFGDLRIIADVESVSETAGGYRLTGRQVEIHLPDHAAPKAYYHHGWQSWSLAAWTPPGALPVQQPAILHPMQIDPLYAHHPSPHGNWLGAVELADGNILLLGALGLDSHVQLREGQLQGWYENAVARDSISHHTWFVGYGKEADVFSAYAQLLGEKFGKMRIETLLRVWCSWYSLYTAIDQELLYQTFDQIGKLPFDVLQVDDGW